MEGGGGGGGMFIDCPEQMTEKDIRVQQPHSMQNAHLLLLLHTPCERERKRGQDTVTDATFDANEASVSSVAYTMLREQTRLFVAELTPHSCI